MRFAPLFVLVLLTAVPALAELDSFGQGTGRDGPLSVTQAQLVVNVAVPVSTDTPAGSRVVRVAQLGGLKAQALVLIHQSSGFPATTASGGSTAVIPDAVGRWELARVSSVSTTPTLLRLTAPLVNSYSVPGAQVVAVPEYTDVDLPTGTSLVAPPWDGKSGGIVAFLATGRVRNDGVVSADGAGFRGGAFEDHVAGPTGCTGLDPQPAQGGSLKGEGVVVSRFGTASGRGHLVNGGGGANCHNGGGGGGGHGNAGGVGGRTASDVDSSRAEGGLGGAHMKYALVDQALFGGGGGAGEGNNNSGTGGGAGGGLVLVRADRVSGVGRISADGVSVAPTPGGDGAGGGGAGGAVIVRTAGDMDCGSVTARGGAGGSVTDALRQLGPGGGGSGGSVLVHGADLDCPIDVTGGAAGTTAFDGTVHGAGAGGAGVTREYEVPYRSPAAPSVVTPASGAVGVSARPSFAGAADPGVRIIISVDDVEVVQLTAGSDGTFSGSYPGLRDPLTTGEHRVTTVAESLGAYSVRSTETTFSVAATLEDGGVLVPPILVIPADGEAIGPTPLFAGVAPNGVTVGVEVDDGPDIPVPVDTFGRFRYQVPADSPLTPGPHRVNVHAHTETGESGPFSQYTRFEVLDVDAGSGEVDAGTEVPDAGDDAGTETSDAGTETPDAGTGTSDAGTGTSDAGVREVPVMVVPAEGEVVDSTPLFAGVAAPGASVSLAVDGAEVAIAVADATGAFRHPVPADQALSLGAHSVTAQERGSVTGAAAGPVSPATGFVVRGPAALDVGCGCGAAPAGVAGVWALVALAAAARRRRR
ncbi:adventurous gliding motility protein AgmC [Pyxidicoccus sp. MSG2]|uniref:adventurous gliding motility protein AgmC n=1 Tax=Pyxidicoccus sp. MSG2 TaxID=2996790 RepID=UPI00226E828F|nr:MYXO-CTERM sorting domain-containing protein [Pyxidicoccus sp. MSG2]MCY1017601.1 MYXO-CTERM sorting domain-containing protein [Pyxidicoccus sp. MSG2]